VLHRNEAVAFRLATVRKARRLLKRRGLYPWVRRQVGADRMRRLRSLATRPPERLPLAEALASCNEHQQEEIRLLAEASHAAVADLLRQQDARLGLDWTSAWPSPAWLESDAR
jgi:hypothetical protein